MVRDIVFLLLFLVTGHYNSPFLAFLYPLILTRGKGVNDIIGTRNLAQPFSAFLLWSVCWWRAHVLICPCLRGKLSFGLVIDQGSLWLMSTYGTQYQETHYWPHCPQLSSNQQSYWSFGLHVPDSLASQLVSHLLPGLLLLHFLPILYSQHSSMSHSFNLSQIR